MSDLGWGFRVCHLGLGSLGLVHIHDSGRLGNFNVSSGNGHTNDCGSAQVCGQWQFFYDSLLLLASGANLPSGMNCTIFYRHCVLHLP